MSIHGKSWWGAPKKLSTKTTERKISWLELFYDLVYVIVISRTTHHFAQHPDLDGLIFYVYIFGIIFWGWFNGSFYYDLHGSPGVRNNLMTLWQMLAVATLAVTLEFKNDDNFFALTMALLFLQGFITYLWWSVGIYDAAHRRLNVPYSVCYLLSFALLIVSIYIPASYKGIVFWIILILNYLPPFVARAIRRQSTQLSLSSSMAERLGLFTIILFGEGILGVINGMQGTNGNNTNMWICFALGILIVFSLWFIFFSLVADRDCKPGFIKGHQFQLMYIPALLSLGMIGASFSMMLAAVVPDIKDHHNSRLFFGSSIAIFLICIYGITTFLVYEKKYAAKSTSVSALLLTPAVIIAAVTIIFTSLALLQYLVIILCVLLAMSISITRVRMEARSNEISNG